MHKSFITKIVTDTLKGMPFKFHTTKADVAMVLATFACETGCYNTPPTREGFVGMMNMKLDDIDYVVHDLIAPEEAMYQYVLDYSMVDVRSFVDEDLHLAAEYNIAFQTILVYLWLHKKEGAKPEDVFEAFRIYKDHWKGAVHKPTVEAIGMTVSRYIVND